MQLYFKIYQLNCRLNFKKLYVGFHASNKTNLQLLCMSIHKKCGKIEENIKFQFFVLCFIV